MRTIFAQTTIDASNLVTRTSRGAIHCALVAYNAFPGGRNELRPYIYHHTSCKNRTHTLLGFLKDWLVSLSD